MRRTFTKARALIAVRVAAVCRLVPLAVSLFFGAGCATAWRDHGVDPSELRLRIAVAPVECTAPIKNLGGIKTVARSVDGLATNRAIIDAELLPAMMHIQTTIEAGLRDDIFFSPVSAADTVAAMRQIGVSDSSPTPAQIKALGRKLHADAILVVKVSGYGKVKNKWFFYLMGTSVIQGGIWAGAAQAAFGNYWISAGLFGEEIIQQYAVWSGVMYVFNSYFTPVIIEARLYGARDGEKIWSDTAWSSINNPALRKFPAASRKLKEIRLRVTADSATGDLLRDLHDAALDNAQ